MSKETNGAYGVWRIKYGHTPVVGNYVSVPSSYKSIEEQLASGNFKEANEVIAHIKANLDN